MKQFRLFILMLPVILLLSGCAHMVSKELRERAADIHPVELMRNPDAYKGRFVILGGIIVSSINTAEGTYIEVLQRPLDFRGMPEETDISHGRFLVLYEGYLDTAIFSRGREITVAGDVMGKMVRPLGEIMYPYLLIKAREVHLLKSRRDIPIRFGIEIWTTF